MNRGETQRERMDELYGSGEDAGFSLVQSSDDLGRGQIRPDVAIDSVLSLFIHSILGLF